MELTIGQILSDLEMRDKQINAFIRLLRSPEVVPLWEAHKDEFIHYITNWDSEGLRYAIRGYTERDLSLRELRVRAASLRIRNYSRMDKGKLINEVRRAERSLGFSETSIPLEPQESIEKDPAEATM